MGTFAETAIVDTVHLLTKENNLPFSVSVCCKKKEVCRFCFPFAANKQKMRFYVCSVFRIHIYIQKKELRENIFVCLIKENRLGFGFLVPN
jgi:hypothetical protein